MPKTNQKPSKKGVLQPLVARIQAQMYRLPARKRYTSTNESNQKKE